MTRAVATRSLDVTKAESGLIARNAMLLLAKAVLRYDFSCDRHKTDMRNGAFCRAAWLTYDPSESNSAGFDLPYFCGFCRN